MPAFTSEDVMNQPLIQAILFTQNQKPARASEDVMNQPVIQAADLTVYYGKHRGIDKLNLTVNQGEIFGFLGPNGAGKTTAIRVLLDIIRPNSGTATIFGRNCQKESLAVRQRVSYIPGELYLPDNMRGQQYLDMVASLRGNRLDKQHQTELIQRLKLDTSRRIHNYSSGNKQKLGLVAAFMHKSDLLILDEPTSGLDPLMQQTVLELVQETKDEGRTVFFSSHILSEVQTVADRVGIIRDGTIVAVERVDVLTEQHFRRLRIRFGQMPPAELFLSLEGVKEVARMDDVVIVEVHENMPAFMQTAATYHILDLETVPVSLEEVFLAYYGNGSKAG